MKRRPIPEYKLSRMAATAKIQARREMISGDSAGRKAFLPIDDIIALRWFPKGNSVTLRSLGPGLVRSVANLERLRWFLNRTLGTNLPTIRQQWTFASLKSFCTGMIEGCTSVWRRYLRQIHASSRIRITVAASLFLFRRVLPTTPIAEDILVDEYISKMSQPQPDISPTYRRFIEIELGKMFPVGWDKGIESLVDSYVPRTTSCLERGRRKGGCRGNSLEARLALIQDYVSFWRGDYVPISNGCEPKVIYQKGKSRVITAFSAKRGFLAPLHNKIYAYLSRFPWLLRGDATPDKFEGFERKEGEVFVSGDYESATDNLNIHQSRWILDCLQSTSYHVPSCVWDEAKRTFANDMLVPRHDGPPRAVRQERGQLMGSYLSFPLLCLANYLAFRFTVPREGVPVRINGDDIAFRSTESEYAMWSNGVREGGLVLSKGKTLVRRSYFSLNSRFFKATGSGVEALPILVSSCAFPECEDPNAIKGRLQDVYGGSGVSADLARALALGMMQKQVWSAQRSLRRGLGVQVKQWSVKCAGLYQRERFYNSLCTEVPLPCTKKQFSQNCIPDGYARVLRVDGQDDPGFALDMFLASWTEKGKIRRKDEETDEFWRRVRSDTFRYVAPPRLRFGSCGVTAAWWKNALERFIGTKRREGKLVWVKERTGRAVKFVPSEMCALLSPVW